ncbi:transglutaminase domain-containing protein [Petrocella sp. FN5]|uniref:transglutaminase domain-containing protein n=1 Tax=Petrocella sp. FN5 TaxID=3032002 RepID=UPI0023DC67FA|nr:transglutaminase domain-containing protein [Petrocella sp. FN5]MDF1618363.1 transglutaminase domain-containing protein [Petrocella sp. FN5]
MKKLLGLLAVIALGLSIFASTANGSEVISPQAEYLNVIGLLKGTGQDYGLNQSLTRQEAAVMIVRLKGDEDLVQSMDFNHPFDDVSLWASSYVGYLYNHGLTRGKSSTEFGAQDFVTQEQYVTLLLRALAYDDATGDFTWSNSLNKAKEIGILSSTSKKSIFTRREMVSLTYNALFSKKKAQNTTLLDQLQVKKAVPNTIDKADKFLSLAFFDIQKMPVSYKALVQNVEKMIYEMEETQTYDMSLISRVDVSNLIEDAKVAMNQVPMYSSVINSYKITQRGNDLMIAIEYTITKPELEMAKNKAKEVVGQIITSHMSDFEKELAIHDYIVHQVTYDQSPVLNPAVFTIYGALIDGRAVCHGYAEAFQYMAYLAGLNTKIVFGTAKVDGVDIGHAWNMIELDGKYYHVDTTWNDPVSSLGSHNITYDYFNVTDQDLMATHSWNKSEYVQGTGTYYNYYTYHKLEVIGTEGLRAYLQNEFNRGSKAMTIKVKGVQMTMETLRKVLARCYGYGSVSYNVNESTNVVYITVH